MSAHSQKYLRENVKLVECELRRLGIQHFNEQRTARGHVQVMFRDPIGRPRVLTFGGSNKGRFDTRSLIQNMMRT